MELILNWDGRLLIKQDDMFFEVTIKPTIDTSIHDNEEQIIDNLKKQLHDNYNSNN
jgi:hypothetical protein